MSERMNPVVVDTWPDLGRLAAYERKSAILMSRTMLSWRYTLRLPLPSDPRQILSSGGGVHHAKAFHSRSLINASLPSI
jgi:hypothetical protein